MNCQKQIDGEVTTYTYAPYVNQSNKIIFFGCLFACFTLGIISGYMIMMLPLIVLLTLVAVSLSVYKRRVSLTPYEVVFPYSLGEKSIPFSEVEIFIDPFWAGLYLSHKDVSFLDSRSWPDELLGDFFSRLPSSLKMTTTRYPEAYHLSDENKAATAFFWLDSPVAWHALVARQLLISLTQKDPEYLFPKDAPEKVRQWRTWLVEEYRERFEISVVKLERAAIKRILPEICVFGVILGGGLMVDGARAPLLAIVGIVFLLCLTFFLAFVRIGPIVRLKRLVRAMQTWTY